MLTTLPLKKTPTALLLLLLPRLPGTILDIKVKAGAAVKAGDVVMILEAMKMENEISAPQDGTIASIDVRKGDTVNSGDVLYTMG